MSGQGRGRGGFRGGHGGHAAAVEVFSTGTGVPQPDATVLSVENAIEKSSKDLSLTSLSLDGETVLPRRPGFGTQGKQITLWANYFELVPPQNLLLYRYAITHGAPAGRDRTPEGKKARWIVQLMLEQHFAQSRDSVITDYSSILLSRTKLVLGSGDFQVKYRAEGEDLREHPVLHPVQLEYTSTLQLSELMEYLSSTNMSASCAAKNDLVQALNIIAGFDAKTNSSILSVGANKHFPFDGRKQRLGAGLEVFRGLFLSVRAATSRILLNVQVQHLVCYEAIPLVDLIQAYTKENNLKLAQPDDCHKLENFLKSLRVRLTHIINKNRAGQDVPLFKTIVGFATEKDGRSLPNPPVVPYFGAGPNSVKFFLKGPTGNAGNGLKGMPKHVVSGTGRKKLSETGPSVPQADEYISVTAFFKRIHQKATQYTDLPVVNVGSQDHPSYLPIDFCVVQHGQPARTNLSPDQTKQMISFAVRKPVENTTSIITNVPRVLGIDRQANSTLSRFDLAMKPSLITVPGRVLTSPEVQYRYSKKAATRFGSWNMESIQFTKPAKMPVWSYLDLTEGSYGTDLAPLVKAFETELRKCGLDARHRKGVKASFAAVDADFKRLAAPGAPKLLLVILPDCHTKPYNHVKRLGDIEIGVHTVCVVASKFAKLDKKVFANVALKFNLKLGGINQTLNPGRLGVLSEGKTMVVGLDVTHPSPDSVKNAPSVAGIVASVDRSLGQWPADLRIQTGKQETIEDLDEMFQSRLRLWQKTNQQQLPENILVYRDGVSEGQYDTVLEEELPRMRTACRKIYPATSTANSVPKISIVIVGKRHHTRFYPTKADDADRSSNPQHGTVVDRGVTEARTWDFFLQAHTAIKGTARPTHYVVILDEIFRQRPVKAPFRNTSDALQDLTHNMCYLYGRATMAVSICPPAYYADLVCERARRYLSHIFEPATPAAGQARPQADPSSIKIHDNLKDTMFYI